VDTPTLDNMSSIENHPRLVLDTGPRAGQVILLAQEWLTLGRASDNDIVLQDLEVSRHHARLRRSERGWVLEDLGSTNGTYVNGSRLAAPHLLRHGDVIDLSEEINFSFRHRPPAPTQPIPRQWVEAYAEAPAASTPVAPVYVEPAAEAARQQRRRGQNPWLLAGVAAGVILGGFLCLALLAYLTLPELGAGVPPGATGVPGWATMTPQMGVSTSLPPTP